MQKFLLFLQGVRVPPALLVPTVQHRQSLDVGHYIDGEGSRTLAPLYKEVCINRFEPHAAETEATST